MRLRRLDSGLGIAQRAAARSPRHKSRLVASGWPLDAMIARWTKNSALKVRSRSLALTAGAASTRSSSPVRRSASRSAWAPSKTRTAISGREFAARRTASGRISNAGRGAAPTRIFDSTCAPPSAIRRIRPSTHSMFLAWTTSLRPNGVNDTPVTLRCRTSCPSAASNRRMRRVSVG